MPFFAYLLFLQVFDSMNGIIRENREINSNKRQQCGSLDDNQLSCENFSSGSIQEFQEFSNKEGKSSLQKALF